MSGGSTPSRTTQTIEPPAYLQPHLQFGARQAQSLYGQGGPKYYPGETVVPFSPQTQQALGLMEQRALSGSPVNQAAQDYATRTLTGDPASQFGSAANPFASSQWSESGQNPYAENTFADGGNPALDAYFGRAADATQQRLASTFAGSGRNIGASRAPMAGELTDLATSIYGGAYENERGRQLQAALQSQQIGASGFENAQARQLQAALQDQQIGAGGYESERDRMAQDLQSQAGRQFGVAGLAPSLAGQDYADLNALYDVGGQYEDMTGRQMEDRAARWDFGQNAPQTNLDNYLQRLGMISGGAGNTSTGMTPTYRNRAAGALGGAATGAGIAGGLAQAGMMTAGSPWGWGLMAAGGLLGAMR